MQQLVAVAQAHAELVAVLQLGLEGQLRLARFEHCRVGGQEVVERRLDDELPHRLDGAGARAEAARQRRAPEVVAAQEADLRPEVLLDEQMVELEAVAVGAVVEARLVARVAARDAAGAGARVVAEEVDVVQEREGGVRAVGLVGTVAGGRDGAMGEDGADAAAPEDVALDAQHREVRVVGARAGLVVRLDAQHAHVERAGLAGQPAAAENGNDPSVLQPDAAAVEERRRIARSGYAVARQDARGPEAAAREVEDAAPLEKELPLLREEQVEAGEVHLLLVHLDLGEVGVVGEVRGEAPGDAVFQVDAHLAVARPARGGTSPRVGGHAADGVRLDLQARARGRRLQADQRARRRHAEHAAASAEPRGRDGNQRQVRPFVLAHHRAAELDAPDLIARRPIAQRLERHHHLDGPAAVEAGGPDVPHRVPVAVRIALVGDLEIRETAQRVGVEEQRVAPVVEGVDEEAEQVVVQQVERVAAHLGGHPLARWRAVPAAARDVEVLVVEHHPGVRALGGRCAIVRELLNEAGDRCDLRVDRLVEPPVHADSGGQPDGADGRLASLAGDHFRRNRRRRTVDGLGRHGRDDVPAFGGLARNRLRLPRRRCPGGGGQQRAQRRGQRERNSMPWHGGRATVYLLA